MDQNLGAQEDKFLNALYCVLYKRMDFKLCFIKRIIYVKMWNSLWEKLSKLFVWNVFWTIRSNNYYIFLHILLHINECLFNNKWWTDKVERKEQRGAVSTDLTTESSPEMLKHFSATSYCSFGTCSEEPFFLHQLNRTAMFSTSVQLVWVWAWTQQSHSNADQNNHTETFTWCGLDLILNRLWSSLFVVNNGSNIDHDTYFI